MSAIYEETSDEVSSDVYAKLTGLAPGRAGITQEEYFNAAHTRRELLRDVAISVRDDVRNGLLRFFRTSFAGSPLMPRIARFYLLRLSGLDIKSFGIGSGVVFENSNVHFAKRAGLGKNCYIEGKGRVQIGRGSGMSAYSTIITSTHMVAEGILTRDSVHKDVVIGEDVYIGWNVLILPGVTIADRVVVGAGSVVTKSLLEPDTLYVGNPARPKKSLVSVYQPVRP
jgi:acetyltransferase-like isoleucine patch superfamily enzyme